MSRIINTESFILKSNETHNGKYDYSLTNYKSTNEKVKITCPIHGVFERTPKQHLRGLECPDCIDKYKRGNQVTNTEQFIEKASKIHKGFYNYSLVNYVKSKTKVKIICPIHGVFEQSPDSHIRGSQGCPDCGKESYRKSLTVQFDEFIERSRLIHGNKYLYNKETYTDSSTSTLITCPIHGNFYQLPYYHMIGRGCKKCGYEITGDKLRSNKEEFIKRANTVHNNKYLYDKVIYKNAMTKVIITCPIHGDFKQNPNSHLFGSFNKDGCGCPGCKADGLSEKFNMGKEEFISRSNDVHDFKYNYDKVEYINSQTIVTIVCQEHGAFEQTPVVHLLGCGCQKCKSSTLETKTRSILKKHTILNIEQKRFSDCKNINPLPFDFYLPELNVCIECQGIQHYEPVDFFGGHIGYIERKINDMIKRNYCEREGMLLIEIPYTSNSAKNIEKILTTNLSAHI